MSRWRKWLGPGIGVLVVGVVLSLTPSLWGGLDRWFQVQRDAVWQKLEAGVGQTILYDRIAPNVLAALDFQNVRVLGADGHPVLTAASIQFSWDWSLVLQGKMSDALRRIQVINAVVTLDSRKDADLVSRVNQFLQAGSSIGFEVDGLNLTARWTDGNRTLDLTRGFAVLSPRQDQWDLRFRGALTWDDRGTPVHADLAVRGDLHSDLGFQNWNLRAQASQVRTSWFDLAPVTVQVSVDPDRISVAKVADEVPLDLQAVWERKTESWTFKGASQDFHPSQLIQLKGTKLWPGLASGVFSGKFSFRPGGDFSFDGKGLWPSGVWPAPLNTSPVAVSGSVRTEDGVYQFQQFHLESALVALDFDGTANRDLNFPQGTIRLLRYEVPGAGTGRGVWTLTRQGTKTVVAGEEVHWNDFGTHDSVGWFEKNGDFWNFDLSGTLDGSSTGRFLAAGSVDVPSSRVKVDLSVSGVPVGMLEPEAKVHWPSFNLPTAVRNLDLDAQARIDWSPGGLDVPTGSFDLHGPPGRHLAGTASWKSRVLDLAVTTLDWDSFHGSGKGNAQFHSEGSFDWTASAQLWDRAVSLQGRWVSEDRTLVFSGAPGVSGNAHLDDAGRWTGDFAILPLEIVPGWSVGVRGRASWAPQTWSVVADRVDLRGRYPGSGEPFVVATRLQVDPGFLRWDDLLLSDDHGRFSGSGASSWSWDWSVPWAGQAEISTPGTNRETLQASWVGTAPDRWNGGVRASGLDLGRVPGWHGPGRLGVTGAASYEQGRWFWNAQTTVTEARWGDSPLGIRASVSGIDSKVSVRNATLSAGSVRLTDASADWDPGARVWNSSWDVALRVGAADWSSRWTSTGTWTPEGTPFRSTFSIRTQANLWAKKSFPDGLLAGHWGAEGWQVGLADGSVAAEGTPDGRVRVHSQAPFPVQADAEGLWTENAVAVTVKGIQADFSFFKEMINTPEFSINRGTVNGAVQLGGVPADPDVTGRLVVHGLVMTSSFVRQTVGPLEVPVLLDGHRLRIDPMNIGPKGQTWLVTGDARLDHFIPEDFQFTLQTDNASAVPVSYQYTGISAKGAVSGLLIVKGSPLAVTLGGRLVLKDTSIILKKSAPDSGKSLGFNVDLALVTGKTVEFLWPNETLPLIRAVTAPDQVMTIRANDVASTWSVTGNLGLKTGEVNYLSHTFTVKEGRLVFQEDQQSFDPRVSVRAEYLVREANSTVTINLRADGTLSQFSPSFDSTPAMSPDELQQFVGTTLTVSNDYSKGTSDAALALASDVGTSFLLSPFEETVKKNFNLDLFTVQTQILKRSLLNRNGPLAAADYLDNTRLFFGKYIGNDFYLQGTVAFSEGTLIYNQDGTVTTEGTSTLVVEPDILMEFRTPLFLLDWDILPRHPETLYVTDNTVTFRWNWSY